MCFYLLHEHIVSVSSGCYNKTGWFKQRYISQLWRLESSKTRLQEDLTLDSWQRHFPLCRRLPLHRFLTWQRESALVSSFVYKGIHSMMRAPPLWTNLTLTMSPKPYLQIPPHWRFRLQHVKHSVHSIHEWQMLLKCFPAPSLLKRKTSLKDPFSFLLYFKWITNKVLLYSTGNSAQCYMATWMGGEFGRMDARIHIAGLLCCAPETITTLSISYTPIQN